ncbi:SRPBCC family protein [Deinococcus roseus]|uniref:Coenzyme Q-binding protein COQ10 START domain-containing protein n=1 Tax=Deinococcus roseus TaxID=392414 RepID=A0ABQ2D162_9DEIO|nr:SRPBCC family protein [Deinococcus roseus]GGJ36462.1 hypothetical protein GCM10008938_23210 [Deinococcus roseus]
MHICTYSASSQTTLQAVWQLWTNIKHWPRWDSQLQSVEMDGAFRQGSTGTLTYQDGSKKTFSIIKLQVQESLVLAIAYPHGSELRIKWDLRQNGSEILFDQEVSISATPFAKLLLRGHKEPLMKSSHNQMQRMLDLLEGEFSPFKDAAARGTPRAAL